MKNIILLLLCSIAFPALSAWQLEPKASTVNFISVKKGKIAEIHHFNQLDGTVSDKGKLQVSIALASVETGIPIRNERMKTFLFDIANYATAGITADINLTPINQLAVGEHLNLTIKGNVSIHGITKSLEFPVTVTHLVNHQFMVVSQKPVIINGSDFNLVAGIEKLQQLAKLPSITTAVPLTFSLIFTAS